MKAVWNKNLNTESPQSLIIEESIMNNPEALIVGAVIGFVASKMTGRRRGMGGMGM